MSIKKRLLIAGSSFLAFVTVAALVNVYWTQHTEVHASSTTLVQRFETQPPAATPDPQDLKDMANAFSKAIDGE